MKYISRYLSLGLLLSQAFWSETKTDVYSESSSSNNKNYIPTWTPLSVGQNLWTQKHKLLFPIQEKENKIAFVTDLSLTYRSMYTRNSSEIAENIFGEETLLFQGSDISQRKGLIAEYFCMGPDTNISSKFSPKIENNVFDFQLEISGEQWWAQINIPVMWTKYTLTKNGSIPCNNEKVGILPLDGATIEFAQTTFPSVIDNGLVTATAGTSTTQAQTITLNNKQLGPTINSPISGARNDAGDITANLYYSSIPFSTNSGNSFVSLCEQIGQNIVGGTILPVPQELGQNAAGAAGYIMMGLYGSVSATDGNEIPLEKNTPTLNIKASSQRVPSAKTLQEALQGYVPLNTQITRTNNLFNFDNSGKWGLADILFWAGYDFYKSDEKHLGAYIKFVLPTGTVVDETFIEYTFNNFIGNGNHFELGAGCSAHSNLWVSDESVVSINANAYISHVFDTCQIRSFDLPHLPLSRYALLYQIDEIGNKKTIGNVQPLGDINIIDGKVSATVHGEMILDLIWATENIEAGVGYSYKGQSAEKIVNLFSSQKKQYAYVGKAPQQNIGVGVSSLDTSSARIEDKAGLTVLPAGSTVNPVTATTTTSPFWFGEKTNLVSFVGENNPIYKYGENTPIERGLIELPQTAKEIMPTQYLNLFFAHVDYTWRDCTWEPEIGIIGSVSFGKQTAAYLELGGRAGFAF